MTSHPGVPPFCSRSNLTLGDQHIFLSFLSLSQYTVILIMLRHLLHTSVYLFHLHNIGALLVRTFSLCETHAKLGHLDKGMSRYCASFLYIV